jgi:hypothetical protein
MLRFLLDEHVSAAVARGLMRINPVIVVHAISQWEDGRFLGRPDPDLLSKVVEQGLTLVTYDCCSIPRILRTWQEQGRRQSGVVFVDEKTIAPGDIGGLVRALARLFLDYGHFNWQDREMFLPRYR